MIKGDYDRLKDIASRNVCAEHKTPLEVAWYGDEKTWILRCGHDHYPDAVTKQRSLTEEYKAGEEIPEPIKSNIEKGMRRRAMTQDKGLIPREFEGVPHKDLATGELLDPTQVRALMDYAHKYHLDPFRGHLVLMYGKPYITIDGYLYYARQTNTAYSLVSRPLGDDELKEYRAPENAHVWISKVKFTETGDEFVGYGVVTQEEMTAKSPRDNTKLRSPVVAAYPWQLAQKRAEWQALRRAFPIGESEKKKED